MKELMKKIYPYIKEHKGKALGSVFLAIILNCLKGYQIYLIKPIFDKGFSPDSTIKEALFLGGLLLGISLLSFPTRFLHFYWIRFVVDNSLCSIRSEIYSKFQYLPLKFYGKNKQGKLLSVLTNDANVFSQGFRSSVDLIREPIAGAIYLGIALYHDWQLASVLFVVAPLFILIFSKSGKLIKNNQTNVQEEISNMTHNAVEGIVGQKISKSFNLQKYVKNRYDSSQKTYFLSQMKTTFVEEMAHPLVEVVGAIAFSGVIVFAHYRITNNQLSIGGFVSFVGALALFMDPIRKFSQANVKLSQARVGAERIFSLLDKKEELDEGNIEVKSFDKSIEINNLSFAYNEHDVIRNFSLSVKKGNKIALVGLSGSGKSTLVNLLLRLYNYDRGQVKIDGNNIENIKLKDLRNLFALVSQDIFLFNDTIRENLTLGQKFSDDQIAMALKVSYSNEFIDKLPNGIDTIVGDRGTRLSGGQQQRITIARAFLQNRDILLFDEATSALDNESEKVVQKALEQIAGDKTVIAIAHRLSTIQDYDQIYVLKEGQVIENGTHEDLMNKSGEYCKLYELSMKG